MRSDVNYTLFKFVIIINYFSIVSSKQKQIKKTDTFVEVIY